MDFDVIGNPILFGFCVEGSFGGRQTWTFAHIVYSERRTNTYMRWTLLRKKGRKKEVPLSRCGKNSVLFTTTIGVNCTLGPNTLLDGKNLVGSKVPRAKRQSVLQRCASIDMEVCTRNWKGLLEWPSWLMPSIKHVIKYFNKKTTAYPRD